MENIFPVEKSTVSKNLLKQNGLVVWLLGLSGAGKTTIASLLEEKLTAEGYFSVLLDGDNLRSGINRDLSFGLEDRSENIRRAAEIAKIMAGNNIITLCSFITPLTVHREVANEILGDAYFEVFVDCPLEVCEERDVKGLYVKARQAGIIDFTGISSAFEPALDARVVLSTATQTPQESVSILYAALEPYIRVK